MEAAEAAAAAGLVARVAERVLVVVDQQTMAWAAQAAVHHGAGQHQMEAQRIHLRQQLTQVAVAQGPLARLRMQQGPLGQAA